MAAVVAGLAVVGGTVALTTWLATKEGAENQITEITNSVDSMQSSISDTLINNTANAKTIATSNQTISAVDVQNVLFINCQNALNFTQDSMVESTAIADIDAEIIVEMKTEFSNAADATIDSVIDIEREFLSPEDKRKYITTMKGDMEQIINDTFEVNNMSNAFANSSGSQLITDIELKNITIDCGKMDDSNAMNFTQQAQVNAFAKATVNLVLEKFSETDGFQEFTGRVESDYSYKSTGPIGETMRGIADFVTAFTGPLIAAAVVAVIIIIIMMSMGGKKKIVSQLK